MVRYEPWSTMRRLQDEMNRAFGSALEESREPAGLSRGAWTPAVDVTEDAERFVISADVPGVDPAEIEITTEKGVLAISGERKAPAGTEGANGGRRGERAFGTFSRRFSLPETADEQGITASGKNGVLEVVIPKKAAVKPKRIVVSG